jgi:hypothetical protein
MRDQGLARDYAKVLPRDSFGTSTRRNNGDDSGATGAHPWWTDLAKRIGLVNPFVDQH